MSRVISLALPLLVGSILAPAFVSAAPKATPDVPALPAPDVKLKVEPREPGKPWRVEVQNTGTVALTLVADERLLRLSIEPPQPSAPTTAPKTTKPTKAQKPPTPTECALPASMRTASRTLTLPPGGRWTADLDPRLLCLDRVDKLVTGATVRARLGWTPPQKGALAPPFVVGPANGGEVASAKEIAAPPVTLDAAASATTPPSAPIVAMGGAARSVATGNEADVTVVVKNASAVAHTIYARPQLVDARVVTPRGVSVTCGGTILQPAPLLDFATRLTPNATWSATVPLSNLCPQGTFDVPGLYLVTPVVHLPAIPKLEGEWSGDAIAEKPQLLRIELGTKPFHDAPAVVTK